MSVVSSKAPNTLELEFQTVVYCLLWLLGIERGSSGRAATALNHWANSPATYGFRWSLLPMLLEMRLPWVCRAPATLEAWQVSCSDNTILALHSLTVKLIPPALSSPV